jgi:hypothetical protein
MIDCLARDAQWFLMQEPLAISAAERLGLGFGNCTRKYIKAVAQPYNRILVTGTNNTTTGKLTYFLNMTGQTIFPK